MWSVEMISCHLLAKEVTLLGPQELTVRAVQWMDDMRGVCEGDGLFELAVARFTLHIKLLVHWRVARTLGARWRVGGVRENLHDSGVQGLEKEKCPVIDGKERVHVGKFLFHKKAIIGGKILIKVDDCTRCGRGRVMG